MTEENGGYLIPTQGSRVPTHPDSVSKARLFLNFVGILPVLPHRALPIPKRALRTAINQVLCLLWLIYTFAVVVCCVKMLYSVYIFYTHCTIWHTMTFMWITLSLKPLQSFVNLLWALLTRRDQAKLLSSIVRLSGSFRRVTMNTQSYIRNFNFIVIVPVLSLTGLLFVIQLVQSFGLTSHAPAPPSGNVTAAPPTNETLTVFEQVMYLSDHVSVTITMVPLYNLWQLTPLLYYVGLLYLCTQWQRSIAACVPKQCELPERKKDLQRLVDHFLEHTVIQRRIGDVFKGFIFANLGISVCTLCLFIYILTNSSILHSPPDQEVEIFYFNMVWCAIQISILFVYVAAICIAGYTVNEALYCLSEKFRLQASWGISIWRGSLIQRGLMFSTFGLIATYAMVLLRMKNAGATTEYEKIPGMCW